MNLPNTLANQFYYWWFDHYADTNSCPRWRQTDDFAEYGCPSFEFLNTYESEALQDAKEFWERNSDDLNTFIDLWKQSLISQKNGIESTLSEIDLFLKKVDKKD